MNMAEKEIKLSFWEPTTCKELEVLVKESQLKEFRLYDITNSVRYKHHQFLESDIVGEFIIKVTDFASDMLDELINNYYLDEISIYEDNKCMYNVSVRLDPFIQQKTINDNIFEISQLL